MHVIKELRASRVAMCGGNTMPLEPRRSEAKPNNASARAASENPIERRYEADAENVINVRMSEGKLREV